MKQRQFLTEDTVQAGHSDPSWKSTNEAGVVHIALPSVKPELVLPKRTSLAIILIANVFLQVSICTASVTSPYRREDFLFHHHSICQ